MFAGWLGESMNKVKPNGFKNDFPCTPPTASPRVLSRETLETCIWLFRCCMQVVIYAYNMLF